jgi:hypothetical protein
MKTPPPKGFIYAGEKLAIKSEKRTRDILWMAFDRRWIDAPNGWHGCGDGPWAVREGSQIAIANGLSPAPPAEPDPALTAFEALAAQINAKLDALNARIERMESRAATMESTIDPTMRELPWNPEWPEPPPLPEGKARWVNRGSEWNDDYPCHDRCVYWLGKNEWLRATVFSVPTIHHIEAV